MRRARIEAGPPPPRRHPIRPALRYPVAVQSEPHLQPALPPPTLAAPTAAPLPARWLAHLQRLPFHQALDTDGRARLHGELRRFVADKHWHGRGIVVTDEIKVVVAAHAALLVMNLEHRCYPNVHTVAIYPSAYAGNPLRGGAPGRPHLGEACADGTVLLAWDAVRGGALDPHDGRNLALHEFAHELDLEDGQADGRPLLLGRVPRAEWSRVFDANFAHLRERVAAGLTTLFDCYAARSRAEFFAVATEIFFERSRDLLREHRELYLLLCRYYGQDPAERD